MTTPEVISPPRDEPNPSDPLDHTQEGPYTFLANPVVDSVIDHIHPEEGRTKDELSEALRLQFSSDNSGSDYHYRLLMGLKIVGFDINPKYPEDPGNEPLLIVADEETFDREFWNHNKDFRFIRGQDLTEYLFGFADQKIAKEADRYPREFSSEFSTWYAKLESLVKVDK